MKKMVVIVAAMLLASGIKAQAIPSWKIKDVVDYYSKKTDSVYVINFWATYCKPCVAEIPMLQNISKKYAARRVKLLLVSLDLPVFYPGRIKSFADKNNLSADIAWLNESDADHFCPVIDKKWSGTIPATIFVNTATGYKKFVESAMTEMQFDEELKKATTISR